MDIKKSVIVGLGALAVYGLKQWMDKSQKEDQSYDLERLLFVIRDHLTQTFQHSFRVAQFKQLNNNKQQVIGQISPDDLIRQQNEDKYLFEEFAKMMETCFKVILQKHDMVQEEYDDLLDTFQSDTQVMSLLAELAKINRNCVQGIFPSLELKDQLNIEQKLGKTKIFNTYAQLLTNVLKTYKTIFEELKTQNIFFENLSDEKITSRIAQHKLHLYKKAVLTKEGFDDFQDDQLEILNKMVQQMKRSAPTDEHFKMIKKIEDDHLFCMDVLLADPFQADSFIEDVQAGKVDKQAFMAKYNIKPI